jgi:DNA-binding response OmpR family regulator
MSPNKPVKILIVEDEEALLQTLQYKLSREGYEVVVARDGVQGLAVIKSNRPDVVLLDILMPKLDGFGVLETLNKEKVIPDLPVIIISNSGQPVEIDRALKLGARDYLVKAEFSPEEVVDKVHKVLGQTNGVGGLAPGAEAGTAGRVFIVEDDQFLRDLMERKLIKEGFSVETAIEGDTGLKKILASKPELVLLDIILPGMDGFSILEKLKQNPEVANIPVILLTNLGQRDDVEKGLKLGAAGYLVKAHFTPGDIVDKVKEVLKK